MCTGYCSAAEFARTVKAVLEDTDRRVLLTFVE
jgi:hypothetical protein